MQMSQLTPKLQLKVAQRQTLTPGLVQMVTVLQLNRLELREMIANEIAENPLLDETTAGAEELTPVEIQAALEEERVAHPADESIMFAVEETLAADTAEAVVERPEPPVDGIPAEPPKEAEAADPFNEIDFGTFFDDYLDPGFRSPASEQVDKPSFETFLSAPVTLSDYLQQQLSLVILSDEIREAADSIIGNLDENGYLTMGLEEIAATGEHTLQAITDALAVVQSLDPAGVGARDLQECLLLQLASRNARGGVAWQIISDHLRLLEVHRKQELAKTLGRPLEHIEIALAVIQHLDPRPGLRYAAPSTRHVEPDVYIFKEGDDFLIQLNDEDLPQLRLNMDYRHMIRRDGEPDKRSSRLC